MSLKYELHIGNNIDGVGLYRTEIPFMLHCGFPSEDEQKARYQEMLQLFPDKPVVLRTLDIGADKQLPYMPISEENPCLGWRGIRVTLDQPEIFLIQLRAMLRANVNSGNLKILLPMVTSMEEIDEAKRLIDRAKEEVEQILAHQIPMPQLGVMIEVPSAIFLLPQLKSRVDFVSIGTNDLTQYLLAVDRNNTHVASLYDCLHPAVIRALKLVFENSRQAGLAISICGEMAGSPMGALLLIGLGYRSLSMSGCSVPRIKYLLRHLEIVQVEQLMTEVLQAETSVRVKELSATFMERHGIGGLVRGGI